MNARTPTKILVVAAAFAAALMASSCKQLPGGWKIDCTAEPKPSQATGLPEASVTPSATPAYTEDVYGNVDNTTFAATQLAR